MTADADRETWINRARAVPLMDEVERRGIKLKRVGVECVGPCPLCGGDDRFGINVKKEVWNCRGCTKGGDVIDLVRHFEELQGQVECLRDWSSGSNAYGIAVSNLAQIVSDGSASTRQRLRAAAAVLAYEVLDAGVLEFVKRFLESLCANAEIATDYRIEAGALLRRYEAPRVVSEIVRPTYRTDESAAEPVEPLSIVVAKQRARADAILALSLEERSAMFGPRNGGNRSDDDSEQS